MAGHVSTRVARCAARLAVPALLLFAAAPLAAQVTGVVEVRNGLASALVRNPSPRPVRVEVALWESDEGAERVELVRPARGNVWPTAFELEPGETQVVRLLLPAEAYHSDTVLRMVTRMVPVAPPPDPARTTNARIVLATRVLSKVLVR